LIIDVRYAKPVEKFNEQVTDPILNYYCKITKSDYLHYGYLEEDEPNLENLQRAQEKYRPSLFLLFQRRQNSFRCRMRKEMHFEKKRSSKLISRSSPEMFKAKGEVPFHLTKFETFETSKKYDLVLMSGVQYQIREGFEKCCTLLNDEGAFVSDYFLRENVARDNMFAVAHKKN